MKKSLLCGTEQVDDAPDLAWAFSALSLLDSLAVTFNELKMASTESEEEVDIAKLEKMAVVGFWKSVAPTWLNFEQKMPLWSAWQKNIRVKSASDKKENKKTEKMRLAGRCSTLNLLRRPHISFILMWTLNQRVLHNVTIRATSMELSWEARLIVWDERGSQFNYCGPQWRYDSKTKHDILKVLLSVLKIKQSTFKKNSQKWAPHAGVEIVETFSDRETSLCWVHLTN